MPIFEIPQDIIDEWTYDALQEFSADEDDTYSAGYADACVQTARTILIQLGIKVPNEANE